jgi:hypothetical protein
VAATATEVDFVNLIAQEIAFGIEDALASWLGRIERELSNPSLAYEEKVRAVALIVEEYKQATGKMPFSCARA